MPGRSTIAPQPPEPQPCIDFPPQARFGSTVPKNKVYERAKASAAVKRRFVEQVEKILWAYKLAPETVNIPAAGFVREVQVFELILKAGVDRVDEAVLRALDKSIAHPIFYLLRSERQLRYAMAYKRQHEGDRQQWVVGDYFFSAPVDPAISAELPSSLDLQRLYEALLRSFLPAPMQGESLAQQIERLQQLAQLRKQADALEQTLHREKQFNRKVELNSELRRLQQQIQALQPNSD